MRKIHTYYLNELSYTLFTMTRYLFRNKLFQYYCLSEKAQIYWKMQKILWIVHSNRFSSYAIVDWDTHGNSLLVKFHTLHVRTCMEFYPRG